MEAEFIATALEGRVILKDQLGGLMQEEIGLYVTKCIVADLAQRAEEDSYWKGSLAIAKNMSFLRCQHTDLAAPHDCIRALLRTDNPDHLLCAIQQVEFRNEVRNLRCVPLMFFRGNVALLESPDEISNQEKRKLKAQVREEKMAQELEALKGEGQRDDNESESDSETDDIPMRQGDVLDKKTRKLVESAKEKRVLTEEELKRIQARMKKKNPNPLSMKKKKIKPQIRNDNTKRKTNEESKSEDGMHDEVERGDDDQHEGNDDSKEGEGEERVEGAEPSDVDSAQRKKRKRKRTRKNKHDIPTHDGENEEDEHESHKEADRQMEVKAEEPVLGKRSRNEVDRDHVDQDSREGQNANYDDGSASEPFDRSKKRLRKAGANEGAVHDPNQSQKTRYPKIEGWGNEGQRHDKFVAMFTPAWSNFAKAAKKKKEQLHQKIQQQLKSEYEASDGNKGKIMRIAGTLWTGIVETTPAGSSIRTFKVVKTASNDSADASHTSKPSDKGNHSKSSNPSPRSTFHNKSSNGHGNSHTSNQPQIKKPSHKGPTLAGFTGKMIPKR